MNLLTPEQVAEILKVRKDTVYSWIRAGKLPAAKLSNRYRIAEEDLEAFVEKAKISKGGKN